MTFEPEISEHHIEKKDWLTKAAAYSARSSCELKKKYKSKMTLMSLMAVRFQNMIYFIFHWVTGFRALLFSQSYTISSQFFFPTSLWQTLHSLHFERLWAFSRFGCRSRSVRKTRLWLCWCALMLLWCFDRKYAPVSPPPYTQNRVLCLMFSPKWQIFVVIFI